MSRHLIGCFEAEFRRYREYAEGAASQLEWRLVRTSLDPETNSIAVVMKHVAGNLRSRWTDPLTTDGEKPWRRRDEELIDDFPDRESLMLSWSRGWAALGASLDSFTDDDLARIITIRTQPHTLALALARSLAHTSYHAGQIVQTARVLASRGGIPWTTLTIPRGGSDAFNLALGANPPPSR